MTPEIRITVELDHIRVVCSGKVEFGATTNMLREVGRIASDEECNRLLFDIRKADYSNYHGSAIKHAQEGPALGIKRSFRMAILGATNNPILKFFEDIGVNRGYRVKTFTDEVEAAAWLRGAT